MKFFKKIIVWILTLESKMILRKYKPFIIAVTGSVGKTSTKDAIYSAIKDQGKYVRKSEKSMNSEVGLPLTIIGAPNAWHSVSQWTNNIRQGFRLIFGKAEYPDCLILELGADHLGDIKRTVKWLKPDIGVITLVSKTPVHVEFFKSPEQLFEEKASLIRAIKKGGSAILFADDDRILALGDEVSKKGIAVTTFGIKEKPDIRGSDFHYEYVRDSREDSGDGSLKKKLVCQFTVAIDGAKHEVTFTNPIGRTGMYPLLAAAGVAKARGMKTDEILKGLNEYQAPKGRMNVLAGINESTLIDDSYNSSPDAVISALQTLKEISCPGRKIAILGDMMELGRYSAEEHRKVGKEAANVAQILITVGQRSRATAEEAIANGMSAENVKSFDSSNDVIEMIVPLIKPGDLVLIKGSQSIRMERVTKALLKEQGKAKELLVRQEPEWLEKA